MADVCISAVADRHALHSVYYSAMKKTPFHLTKRVSAACDAHCNVVNVAHVQHDSARNERVTHCRAHFAKIAKSPMK
jgi:hypothetical protein